MKAPTNKIFVPINELHCILCNNISKFTRTCYTISSWKLRESFTWLYGKNTSLCLYTYTCVTYVSLTSYFQKSEPGSTHPARDQTTALQRIDARLHRYVSRLVLTTINKLFYSFDLRTKGKQKEASKHLNGFQLASPPKLARIWFEPTAPHRYLASVTTVLIAGGYIRH